MTRWLIICLLPLLPLAAAGELYRWVDDEGRVHFGDREPEQAAGDAEQVQIEAPKPIGQGTDLKQINERLEKLREKERQRLGSEQAAAEKRERAREKVCRDGVRRYNRMKRNFVYERDDGSTYQISQDQVREDRARLRAWLDEHCPGM